MFHNRAGNEGSREVTLLVRARVEEVVEDLTGCAVATRLLARTDILVAAGVVAAHFEFRLADAAIAASLECVVHADATASLRLGGALTGRVVVVNRALLGLQRSGERLLAASEIGCVLEAVAALAIRVGAARARDVVRLKSINCTALLTSGIEASTSIAAPRSCLIVALTIRLSCRNDGIGELGELRGQAAGELDFIIGCLVDARNSSAAGAGLSTESDGFGDSRAALLERIAHVRRSTASGGLRVNANADFLCLNGRNTAPGPTRVELSRKSSATSDLSVAIKHGCNVRSSKESWKSSRNADNSNAGRPNAQPPRCTLNGEQGAVPQRVGQGSGSAGERDNASCLADLEIVRGTGSLENGVGIIANIATGAAELVLSRQTNNTERSRSSDRHITDRQGVRAVH